MQLKRHAFLVIGIFLCVTGTVSAQVNEKTQRQIEWLLREKQARTPAQRKIDSRLLQALRERQGEKMADSVDLEPVNVKADKAGNLDVDISAEITDALLKRLQSLGGVIIFPSAQYRSVRARINLSAIETIAAYPEITFIQPAVEAFFVGSAARREAAGTDKTAALKSTAVKKSPFEDRAKKVRARLINYLKSLNSSFTGTITSGGDHAHRADDVRKTYGYEGQGVKIAVLSDSYDAEGGAAADVANGNLPGPGNPLGSTTPVTVLFDNPLGSDEGRAMLQIVHDLAPKAQLYFVSVSLGPIFFSTFVQFLQSFYGCDIIIDDVIYPNEPAFQDGPVAQAVNTATANGAFYFSSAGNEGSVAKGTAGYFEGDFNDVGSPVFAYPGGGKAGTIHNFGTVASPVAGDVVTAAGAVYSLTWADPQGLSSNDYDLFLVSSLGAVKASSTNSQTGGQDPLELIAPPALAPGDRLVVFKAAVAKAVAFSLNTYRGRLANFTTGETHGHSAAVNAFSVAATPAGRPAYSVTAPGPYPGVFTSSNGVEGFSSDGPRRIFFNADGTAVTPGNFLFGTNGGTVRNKPDFTAADGVATTLGATSGLNPFFGTSAAAPHAGAIAALLKSANPSLTLAQLRTALTSTALDIESEGYDNVSGYGILQAFQAMQSLTPSPLANIRYGAVTASEGSTANSNGIIDPNEEGKILAQLINPTTVSATAVNATLTTTTPGVTILQGAASYGTLSPSTSVTNTGTPFRFRVSPSVACGTVINFSILTSFSGGTATPQGFSLMVGVGQPGANLNGAIGSTLTAGAGYTATSGAQTGLLNRSGTAATCAAPKAAPGLAATTGSRSSNAYTFTNASGANQCVTVTLTSDNGIGLYTVAYNNAGFVPSNPNMNFLADAGSLATTQQFSFTAPAAQNFTVVVHDVNPGTASGTAYNLNVSLNACTGAAPLPVTWLAFTATERAKQSLLQWKVANEAYVDRYEVEYSTDGMRFEKLYTLPATATRGVEKTYEQLHPFPVAGNNHYRIRQVDVNGRFAYSKIASVKIDKVATITLTPNPVSGHALIQARAVIQRIQLYNATGQLVLNESPGKTTHTLNLRSLSAGQYFVRIESDGEVLNEKIIKQ